MRGKQSSRRDEKRSMVEPATVSPSPRRAHLGFAAALVRRAKIRTSRRDWSAARFAPSVTRPRRPPGGAHTTLLRCKRQKTARYLAISVT